MSPEEIASLEQVFTRFVDSTPTLAILLLAVRWLVRRFERQLEQQELLNSACRQDLAEVLTFIRRKHPE